MTKYILVIEAEGREDWKPVNTHIAIVNGLNAVGWGIIKKIELFDNTQLKGQRKEKDNGQK